MPNKIHESAIIGNDVALGDDNVIGPGAILMGHVVIGNGNWIGPGTVIGGYPDIYGVPAKVRNSHYGFDDRNSEFGVLVGSNNVFKEYVTIHAGSHRHTEIASDCYLMPRSHLGHDCWIGNSVMLSPAVQVAGHVAIGDRAVLGMGALVHQFSAIGPVAMVGMGAVIRGQVDPCRTVVGEPHRVSGINKIGISRLLGPDVNVSEVMMTLRDPTRSPDQFPLLSDAISTWKSRIVNR